MTEEEWLKCEDPTPMLEFLLNKPSNRKLRLFGVACCRNVWRLLEDERVRRAVDVAEMFADGEATEVQLERSSREVRNLFAARRGNPGRKGWAYDAAFQVGVKSTGEHPATFIIAIQCAAEFSARAMSWYEENDLAIARNAQSEILRCMMGNPFRPVSPGHWITSAAVTVARDAYDRRDFSALPVLADLLEEAGCPDQSVLDHCRGPGEHARGCHVVDLVLGKG
jgi:hypothetical protein